MGASETCFALGVVRVALAAFRKVGQQVGRLEPVTQEFGAVVFEARESRRAQKAGLGLSWASKGRGR
jgi:hypothetical protein